MPNMHSVLDPFEVRRRTDNGGDAEAMSDRHGVDEAAMGLEYLHPSKPILGRIARIGADKTEN